MTVSFKNIRKKTPINIEKIGTGILMLTAGMTPIVASLPVDHDVTIWVNAGLSTLGLIAKVITMMFAEKEIIDGAD